MWKKYKNNEISLNNEHTKFKPSNGLHTTANRRKIDANKICDALDASVKPIQNQIILLIEGRVYRIQCIR